MMQQLNPLHYRLAPHIQFHLGEPETGLTSTIREWPIKVLPDRACLEYR